LHYFKKLRNVFGWILTRYQKGYGLVSTFISAFNFAGIWERDKQKILEWIK